ncbi:MAG TPA: hypothetical protein VG144_14035 [Gaiellaceae bacterium]|nr:hypothetical protein [Gaiellaceae bacterium]
MPRAARSKKPARAAVAKRAPARVKVKAAPAVAQTAAPTPAPSSEAAVSERLFLFVTFAVLTGLLLIGASAVPPARVPWPAIARPLFVHRSNLAAIGMGTIAIALVCLNIAVF